ncbi:MAG: HesA/MoeB/ThiF family protein [Bacteroidota bacterium]|nr:HesA/MoeB/ThiF family protein [Bacteroidota bacterium]
MVENISEEQYYSRQILLPEIGIEGQKIINNASVLVIGAGGLGAPVLQYLAASGIGTIGIADFDKVSVSNLHRQTIYSVHDIGKSKIDCAKTFVQNLNPFITVKTYQAIINQDNILSIINDYQVIIDCTDNPISKYLINDACILANKVLIYGSVYKFEGNVSVFNLNDDAPNLRCLFPEQNNDIPDCVRTGVLGMVTGITGMYMANEALKVVLDSDHILSNKLLIFNGLTSETKIFNFETNPYSRKECLDNCNNWQSSETISVHQLKELLDSKADIQLLDIRTEKEREICHIGGIFIPLNELEERLHELNPAKRTIVYCHLGIRSQNAVDFLRDFKFTQAQSLHGGIHEWSLQIDNQVAIY